MGTVRKADPVDIEVLWAIDSIARVNEQRREYIRRAVERGNCFALVEDTRVVGCAIFDYSFYEQGFLALVNVDSEYRRRGAASQLFHVVETICQTTKLFTSTNLSNQPMQALLAKLGYILSGVIHHLDEGDPELVYVKYLK
jgi:ribosomal protein S18 acetylase RimI-like enzyme